MEELRPHHALLSARCRWVTLDIGAQASSEVRVQPGDVIFGNMTMIGKGAWYIDSVSQATGKHTSLTASGGIFGGRLDVQPWAYVTLECYGCTSCRSYPQGGSTCAFADMQLASSGSPVVPTWQVRSRPRPSPLGEEPLPLSFGTDRQTQSRRRSTSATSRSRSVTRQTSSLGSGRKRGSLYCRRVSASGLRGWVTFYYLNHYVDACNSLGVNTHTLTLAHELVRHTGTHCHCQWQWHTRMQVMQLEGTT